MIDLEQLHDCYVTTSSKIVLLVVDGLGGLPHPDTGRSELETANLPNLDAMARESACGVTTPVLPGVAPGSGPGHLALFGYDPLKYIIGRGALEALGIDVELRSGDVAARGNFCTVDGDGNLVDRRAGRIPTEFSAPLCKRLDTIELPGVQLDVFPVQDYRFVLRLRGEGLSEAITETDPQITGVPALPVKSLDAAAEKTAALINDFVAQAGNLLAEEERGNMVLLRGWAQLPSLPPMGQIYRINPAGIAAYPMYRGLATVANMRIIPTGHTFSDEVDTLHEEFENHDFFFIHYKPADAAGEDGDFEAKVQALEDLDPLIPRIRELNPDVFMVAGDHSTPAIMAAHSWHPVPFMLHSKLNRGEGVPGFDERACNTGSIGSIPATYVMLLAMSHAGKLTKYGP
ncbi:Probable 2,3-bisphosphoglycerate-independent phosphoglycerate mutase [Geodia barretti]|uniref:Probable 2,3-bisphosphoglycerate-independent phosphoglycerate mutase n=1 Tax=Geodia barretti TaxID=519541 RepID=A0AA35VZW3_GEOBA|nr:Probable 2,3-bisphosphoglycerate-independent phosphoglycerate mutase [Geodia barretti]